MSADVAAGLHQPNNLTFIVDNKRKREKSKIVTSLCPSGFDVPVVEPDKG